MTNNKYSNNDDMATQDDLTNHGVKDIIPENEEYYTLDLKRNFDGDENEEDELAGFDVSNVDPHNLDELDEPPKSASVYSDATLVHGAADYRTKSNSPTGMGKGNHIKGEETVSNDRVGDAGHWGVDEDTE